MKKLSCLAASVATIALAASGCGSDDGGSGGEVSASATCKDAKLTYQLGFIPNAQHTGFLVAYDKKLFADEGVDIEMKPGGPVVNPALQVAQGTVDMTDLPMADALNASGRGADIRLVAQTAQQNPLRYISLEDHPLASPEDLEGATVGVQQAGNVTPELAVLLREADLTPDDVKIEQIAFDVSDFLAKKVEVFPLRTYAHIAMLKDKGMAYPDDVNVLDPNQYGASVPDEGIWVNNEFLEKNGSAVVCALRAIRAGWDAALADPEEAKKIIGKYAPSAAFSPEAIDIDVDEVLTYATTTADGATVEPLTLDEGYLIDGGKSLQGVGAVPKDLDVAKLIDPAPLEAASKE